MSIEKEKEKAFYKSVIKSENDIQTTYEEYRSGFLKQALEKNRLSEPHIKEAVALKAKATSLGSPEALLEEEDLRNSLLLAAGVSEKASKILSEEDKTKAIENLIEKFLKPSGLDFADELVYRYLIFKGDSFGGTMRNLTGKLAKEKLVSHIIGSLIICNMNFKWAKEIKGKVIEWETPSEDSLEIQKNCKALYWKKDDKERILIFDFSFNINDGSKKFKNNVDICLFNETETVNIEDLKTTKENVVLLGELKGGIDPAGADEHWKTANSALSRIRDVFGEAIDVVFVGAAIEERMSKEIFEQLENGVLSCVVNLNKDSQLGWFTNWLIER